MTRLAASPEEFVTEAIPRFVSQLARAQHEVAGLKPGASLPPKTLSAVARACDGVVAEAVRAARAASDPAAHKLLRRAFRESLRSLAKGNLLLEQSLGQASYPSHQSSLIDQLDTPAPVFSGGFGGLIGGYLHQACRFVVHRKEHLVEHLTRALQQAVATDDGLTVLAVDAGPCREWVELDWDLGRPVERRGRVDLLAVDRDAFTLQTAKSRLQLNRLLRRARYLSGSWRDLDNAESLGPQSLDLIYACGTADELSDRLVAEAICVLGRRLAPGGTLIMTHTDAAQVKLEVVEWFLGLALVHRSADDFAGIVRRAVDRLSWRVRLRLRHDPPGTTVFALIQRPENRG